MILNRNTFSRTTLGAKSLLTSVGSALSASALTGGSYFLFEYNGTAFIQTGGGGGSSSTFYTISFDGMGTSLSGAATRCIAIKATGSLQSVRLQACNGYAASPVACNVAGSGTFDILTVSNASYASTGPSAASSIHGAGSLLSISSAYAAHGNLTNWTTVSFGGQTACVAMSAPTAISLDVILEVK